VNADGTFEIALAAGRVLLRAALMGGPSGPGAPPPWRLKRVIVNDLDAADTGIDVPANAILDNVVVEMTNQNSEIEGRVLDAGGTPVRDCFVIVFSQDPVHWTVLTATCSSDVRDPTSGSAPACSRATTTWSR
jgi:hypothetical protein